MDKQFIHRCTIYYTTHNHLSQFFFLPGNIATIRSYIVDATFLSERTTELAMISSTQALGFLIGPGFQSALTPLECANPTSETYIAFDMYTSTGYENLFV